MPQHLCQKLFDGATRHAEANGDFEFQSGDLEVFLRAALDLLTPRQLSQFFLDEQVDALLDTSDYGGGDENGPTVGAVRKALDGRRDDEPAHKLLALLFVPADEGEETEGDEDDEDDDA